MDQWTLPFFLLLFSIVFCSWFQNSLNVVYQLKIRDVSKVARRFDAFRILHLPSKQPPTNQPPARQLASQLRTDCLLWMQYLQYSNQHLFLHQMKTLLNVMQSCNKYEYNGHLWFDWKWNDAKINGALNIKCMPLNNNMLAMLVGLLVLSMYFLSLEKQYNGLKCISSGIRLSSLATRCCDLLITMNVIWFIDNLVQVIENMFIKCDLSWNAQVQMPIKRFIE